MSEITEVEGKKIITFDGKKYNQLGTWGDENTTGGYERTILGETVTVHPNKDAKKIERRKGKEKLITNLLRTNWFFGGKGNVQQYPEDKDIKSTWWDAKKHQAVEAKSYDVMVQKIGEIYYGAEWNPTANIFNIINTQKYDSYKKIKGYADLHGLKGWAEKNIKDAIRIIEGFDKVPTQTKEEKLATEKTFGHKADEVTEIERQKFYGVWNQEDELYEPIAGGSKAISDWRNQMRKDKKSVQTADALVGSLYAFLSINGKSGNPEWLTTDLSKVSIADRMKKLETAGRIYQHWVQTQYTPTVWWETPFKIETEKFNKMPITLRQAEKNLNNARTKTVLPSTWRKRGGNLPDGIEDEAITTQVEANDYAGYSSVKIMKHAVASFISSKYDSPIGYWVLDEQKSGDFFSRGVPKGKYGTIGKDLTPEQVHKGMEFLRTGLNPDIKDDVPENHYNESLSYYEEYGSPYGELAPANMFFRIALSGTGWRKQEAVTAQTQELASYPADEDNLNEKLKSGIYLDEEFGLGVKFMTRKTAKYGVKDHTSNIPPFSSDLIDTTTTINLILKQANVGQIYVEYEEYEDEDGIHKLRFKKDYPKFIKATQEDKEKWHPATKRWKYNGQTKTSEFSMNTKAGQTPKCLVGADGQFLPVDQIEWSDATEDKKIKWTAEMTEAYLFFPFKEMYAIMEGTKVRIRTPAEILEVQKEDNDYRKKVIHKEMAPVFDMFDKPTKAKTMLKGEKTFGAGWAVKCKTGCSPKFTGKIAVGYMNKKKMDQDDYRYEDESGHGVGYWVSRPAHSIRHVFAQTWLKIFEWNYGLVADYGHWQVMETLKDNYGQMPKKLAKQKIAEGFAKDFKTSAEAKQFAESRSNIIKNAISDVAVKNLQDEIPEGKPREIKIDEGGEVDE